MKLIIGAVFGIWIGREIFSSFLAKKQLEREERIRKRIERFIRQNAEGWTEKQISNEVEQLLK